MAQEGAADLPEMQSCPHEVPDNFVLLWRENGGEPYRCQWPGCGRSFKGKNGAKQHGRSHRRAMDLDPSVGVKTHTGFRPLDPQEYPQYRREYKCRFMRSKRAKAERERGRGAPAQVPGISRTFPRALAEILPKEGPPAAAAAVRRGCQFVVISDVRPGSGELEVYGNGRGDDLLGAIKSALCWATLHRRALKELFTTLLGGGDRPVRFAVEEPGRADRDVFIDLSCYEFSKTGSSLGLATACSFVRLMTGVGVERCVALTGVVSPSGLVMAVGGLEGKLRVAAEADDIEVVVLPRINYEHAQILLNMHGWSERVRLLPVSDMEEVLRLLFLQSIHAEPPVEPPQPRLLVPEDRRLVSTRALVVDWAEVELPVFECALVAGRGRTVCTGMSADNSPVIVEEARKVVAIAKALCRGGLASQLRHDLSDASKWDVHVHLRNDGSGCSGEVGLAILAGLLALALGRTLDLGTVCFGALILRGKIFPVGCIKREHVLGLARRGCRRVLLCPAYATDVEELKQQLLQEEHGDEQLRAGLQALQSVTVPSIVTDGTVADLVHALWPPVTV